MESCKESKNNVNESYPHASKQLKNSVFQSQTKWTLCKYVWACEWHCPPRQGMESLGCPLHVKHDKVVIRTGPLPLQSQQHWKSKYSECIQLKK